MFDIGGTNIRGAVYDGESDQLISCEREETPSFHVYPNMHAGALRSLLYEAISRIAKKLLHDDDPEIVSIGFPGPVNSQGIVLRAPTVWGGDNDPEPVASRIEKLWPKAQIFVANDLTCAGYCFLKEKNESLCVVTVSSGIGHKIFINGRPQTGASGRGGELGHLRVDFTDTAPVCDCGETGHLGALASGRATYFHVQRRRQQDPVGFDNSSLNALFNGDLSNLENHVIAGAFHAGDDWTLGLIKDMAEPLGRALAAIHSIIGVERFVIIGGFANSLGSEYLSLLGQAASSCEWDLNQDWNQMLEIGIEGDNSGLIGAGRLALLDAK